jgi:hypothetical protein
MLKYSISHNFHLFFRFLLITLKCQLRRCDGLNTIFIKCQIFFFLLKGSQFRSEDRTKMGLNDVIISVFSKCIFVLHFAAHILFATPTSLYLYLKQISK